jgi:hypothetical protein
LGESVNRPRFRDVCTPRGKWFHAAGELFRGTAGDETIRHKISVISTR